MTEPDAGLRGALTVKMVDVRDEARQDDGLWGSGALYVADAVESILAAHPAHIADEAAIKATALREAADILSARWVEEGRHEGLPGCYSSGYEQWLRKRADSISTAPAPPVTVTEARNPVIPSGKSPFTGRYK